MMGGSTEGYSLTPKKLKPIAPNISITSDSTIAKTGPSMLIFDNEAILHRGYEPFI